MCNTFNSCVFGCNIRNSGNSCGLWSGYQRICRDCCGNIIVRNSNTCGYNCGCCGCQCSCCGSNGSGGSNGAENNQNGNGNGGYGCLTLCGNWRVGGYNAVSASNVSGDDYYAAQYALGRSGCSCGYANNT